jgi:ferredoxin
MHHNPAKALPAINPARCTGCGWCVAVCPPHVLSLQAQDAGGWGSKTSQLHDEAGCTGCALCAVRCPFDAIDMVRRTQNQGTPTPSNPTLKA